MAALWRDEGKADGCDMLPMASHWSARGRAGGFTVEGQG